MGNYQELAVWRKAHGLVLSVYGATTDFPKEEIYGLTSQMRRAAISIPANIAEGSGKGGDTEFIRYLRISLGSTNELEYHCLLAHDLGLLDSKIHPQLKQDVTEVRRMLTGLIKGLVPHTK
jgi:four helix bundle protein